MDCCLQKNIRTLENAKLVGPVHCYPSLTHSLTNTMDWKSFWGNCRNNPPTKWVAMQIRPRTTRCLPCCFLRHPIFGGDSGASHQLKARGFPQPCIRQKWRVGRRGSPPQGVDRAIGGSRGDTHVWSNMGLSENSVPLHPMVLLIIIPTKWLFHWGYTPFSDIPNISASVPATIEESHQKCRIFSPLFRFADDLKITLGVVRLTFSNANFRYLYDLYVSKCWTLRLKIRWYLVNAYPNTIL